MRSAAAHSRLQSLAAFIPFSTRAGGKALRGRHLFHKLRWAGAPAAQTRRCRFGWYVGSLTVRRSA